MRFVDKVIVITGAGSGVGEAMARRFAREGAQVFALDVSGKEEEVARAIGDAVTPIRCDVADPEQVKAAFDTVRSRAGKLDVLCNNAGVSPALAMIHEYDLAEFDRVMAVNLRGAFIVLQAGLRVMMETGGGAIVNTASVGAVLATKNASPYLASKAALKMLTQSAAYEYAGYNIRVNAIGPSAISTPMMRAAPIEMQKLQLANVLFDRALEVDEVAGLAAYLASDEASYITGQTYLIDGGRSIK